MKACVLYFVGRVYGPGVSDMTKTFLVRQAMKGFQIGSRTMDAKRLVYFQLLLVPGDKLMRFVGAILRWYIFVWLFPLWQTVAARLRDCR